MPEEITTGFPDFDKSKGGLPRGGITVLGARPQMGKTELAANIAVRAALA